MSLVRFWMRLFNWLLLVQGLVVVGFTIYVAAVNFSSFVYVLAALGGYITATAIIGIRSINNGSRGCVNLFSLLFLLLILLHAVIAVGFLFYESKTVEILQKLNEKSPEDNNRVVQYLDNHKHDFKIASIIVVGIELFTFCLAACCTRSVAGPLDDDMEAEMDMRSVGLLTTHSEYGHTVSATPQTDTRRAQMSAKYGGVFQKRETNPYMVV